MDGSDEWLAGLYLDQTDNYGFLSAEGESVASPAKLVEGNLKFVASLAKPFTGRGVSYLDLIQGGNLGLIQASERFDPERGFRFNSYSKRWIMGGITDALFSGFRFGVRITECAGTGTFRTIDTFKERYFRLHGRGPTDLEILGGAKVTKRALTDYHNFGEFGEEKRDPNGGSKRPRIENVPSGPRYGTPEKVETPTIQREFSVILETALSDALNPLERQVVLHYFGMGDHEQMNYRIIGEHWGDLGGSKPKVEKTRVEQVFSRSLKKLRGWFEEKGLAADDLYDRNLRPTAT
jgi:RNA polymerase primary sigma factor